MHEKDHSENSSIGIRKDVIKTTPNRVTALWLFGIFILISVSFIGAWIGFFLFRGFTDVAYCFGFFVVLFVSSVIGWFTIVIQENATDLKIKVIKEK